MSIKFSLYQFLIFGFFLGISFPAWSLPVEIKGEDLLKKQIVHVKAQSKKALVVVFLSAKCPCSDSHIEELKDLHKNFPEFEFVAVHSNLDENEAMSQEYFKKVNLPFPVVQDNKVQLADQFHALKTPHAFVVQPNGQTAYQGGVSSSKRIESADRKLLREALLDLKENKSVRTPEGRTLGCAIERGEKNVW